VSDIDTAVVDSLKVLDLKWPIREADIKRTSREIRNVPIPEVAALFDHLVGADEQRRWNREAHCLGRLEIDDHLEFRGRLNGKVSRIGPL
jgi:hypothetical protein